MAAEARSTSRRGRRPPATIEAVALPVPASARPQTPAGGFSARSASQVLLGETDGGASVAIDVERLFDGRLLVQGMTTVPTAATLGAGDHVLFGTRDEAKPQDWRIAHVLAAHDDLVVVESEDELRRRIRSISPDDVVAVSRSSAWLQALTVARQLLELRLHREIADVLAAESRLASARDALWAGVEAGGGVRAPVVD